FSSFFAWAGDNTVQSNRVAAQNLTLTLNSYNQSYSSRTLGSTVNFFVTGGLNGVENQIVLSGLAAGFIDQGTFFGGSDYAWNESSGSGNVRGPDYGTDAGTATSGTAATLASTNHVEITGPITAQTDATFTTLKINGANDLTVADGQTLTTRGVLKAGGGSATISGGTLQPGGTELVVRTDLAGDSLTIGSAIADGGGTSLVKSGAGTLTLLGTNSFSGHDLGYGDPAYSVYLNAGVVSVPTLPTGNEAGPLGTGALQFAGGTLRYTGTDSVTTTRQIVLVGGGGGIEITQAGATVTLDSGVVGPGDGLASSALVRRDRRPDGHR
ncbi:MAG: hypothetical protein NTV51_18355, partial [Verrucomicrobia bacterium]|nr:hypothetical protein [Verrucomicrobiota bacterium]